MLRDLYFYPLALLVTLGIVLFALSLGAYERPSDTQIKTDGYILEGDALTKLTASAGTNYDYVAATGSSPAYVRLWTHVRRDNVGASAGIFAPLNSDYERVFAGERLRMTVTARQSRNRPLEQFDVGYFTAGAGDSGWKRMNLTPGWSAYSFEFTPGFPQDDPDIDYFGIWPGETAEPLSMDVAKMQIEVLP
jgi:hypothetical protein